MGDKNKSDNSFFAMISRMKYIDSMDYNVVYAQMGRGKMERNVAFALASIAGREIVELRSIILHELFYFINYTICLNLCLFGLHFM